MNLNEMLNPPQLEAVEFGEGPLLVLAGAGSGKTRVVTLRIVNLIEMGVPPNQILGLTFTNKAAQEMKERINKLSNSFVQISTFHSLGAKILRESIQHLGYKRDFTIYDEEDAEKLIKVCLAELNLTSKKLDPRALKQLISQSKNSLKLPEEIEPSHFASEIEMNFPAVYTLYQKKLQECNATDFDDLLLLPVRLFREHPDILGYYQNRWTFLLIDEYQDTNAVQYEIVRMLVSKSKNIFAVGDPDQSIYSWRGADITNILNFEQDFPGAKVVRLEQNYRSYSNILDAANALISQNRKRYEKTLWSDLGPGEKIRYAPKETEKEEVAYVAKQAYHHHTHDAIPLNEMVIFYRTNFQSRSFEDKLISLRIPYVIVGGISFYQRREIKDILAFLRMVQSGLDMISFERTINLPKRGIGDTTIEKLRAGALQSNLQIYEYCSNLVEDKPVSAPIKLTVKQKEGLKDYVNTIHELRSINEIGSLRELIKAAIERTRYLDVLKEDPETFDDRKGNLDELVSKAAEWEDTIEKGSLDAFLEELSLKTTLDEATNESDRLNLMTFHNGKGLEFKVVFLVGLEETLFPHANSYDKGEPAMEEERRLCYVGMTRAKQLLYLTNCKVRYLWGVSRPMKPSRFINEIPSQYIEKIRPQYTETPKSTSHPYEKTFKRKDAEYDEDFIDDIDQTKEQVVYRPREKIPAVEPANPFDQGDAVFHKQFGIGIVKRVYQGSLGITYEIHFTKDDSKRNIVAKYADLSKLLK